MSGNITKKKHKSKYTFLKKMNKEYKQKIMLLDELSAYIKEKHTQEECIGFIDGYKAAISKIKLSTLDFGNRFSTMQKVHWGNNKCGFHVWVVKDNGLIKVLVANTDQIQDPQYEEWWVNRSELIAF